MKQAIQFFSTASLLSSGSALAIQFVLDCVMPRMGISAPRMLVHLCGQALLAFLLWKGVISIYTSP